MEVVDQNRVLKNKNDEVKEQLKFKESLTFEGKAYWSNKTDDKKDGPFCSNCWDTKKLTVRLHVNGPYHICPNCKVNFIYPDDDFVGVATSNNPFSDI